MWKQIVIFLNVEIKLFNYLVFQESERIIIVCAI